jgi:hypothetical protein
MSSRSPHFNNRPLGAEEEEVITWGSLFRRDLDKLGRVMGRRTIRGSDSPCKCMLRITAPSLRS